VISVSDLLPQLRQRFGERLQTEVELRQYTSARVGGPAEAFLVANTADELADIMRAVWEMNLPSLILGGGSNVLVSDAGVRGVVVLNRSRQVHFYDHEDPPRVWAESGVNFGALARQTAARGLGGLEWAAGIPGTLGGAVVGNAGAHGGDLAGNLLVAEILHRIPVEANEQPVITREEWTAEQFQFTYRTSRLKQQPGTGAVLAASLRLEPSTPDILQARVAELTAIRRRTQPPGASMGSMFKNPPGDYAGRLIDAAGLKGVKIGDAEISSLHANFFINHGNASASDIYQLIVLAQQTVKEKFGVELELEIALVGEWHEI
jgi:UDP-N-acetylmuramate dehydrogenase